MKKCHDCHEEFEEKDLTKVRLTKKLFFCLCEPCYLKRKDEFEEVSSIK